MNHLFLYMMAILFLHACANHKSEDKLGRKEAALNQKEQELSLKEKSLQLKEEDLLKREKLLDSTVSSDTVHLIKPMLAGNWSVKMTCTETTCSGSAVGDTKTEQWQLSYESNSILAKAMSGGQLVRVYTGFYTGNTVELVATRDSTAAGSSTKMVVRLTIVDEMHLDGQREITRDDCKVIYSLQMEKQKD
jgi:hypothetical protein